MVKEPPPIPSPPYFATLSIQVNTAYVVGMCNRMGRERFSYGLCVEGKEDLHRELYGEKHNSEILAFFQECTRLFEFKTLIKLEKKIHKRTPESHNDEYNLLNKRVNVICGKVYPKAISFSKIYRCNDHSQSIHITYSTAPGTTT